MWLETNKLSYRWEGTDGGQQKILGRRLAAVHEARPILDWEAPDVAIAEFLSWAGAAVDHLHLPDFGVLGNGHGLIYEKNSDETLAPVLNWLNALARGTY